MGDTMVVKVGTSPKSGYSGSKHAPKIHPKQWFTVVYRHLRDPWLRGLLHLGGNGLDPRDKTSGGSEVGCNLSAVEHVILQQVSIILHLIDVFLDRSTRLRCLLYFLDVLGKFRGQCQLLADSPVSN